MHDDEIPVNEAMVARLLREQAQHWAGLALRRLASSGTDNAIFRLGDRLLVRVPRRRSAAGLLSKELDWLSHLQGLPLEVPVPRFRGWAEPGAALEFGIFDWIDGQIATPDRIADRLAAATALAQFLKALQGHAKTGGPVAGASNGQRGVALAGLTAQVLAAIETLADEVDAPRAHSLWHAAAAARAAEAPVWVHGDLKADNLIARDGALCGVIDWGLSALGDPAADYATAWVWVDPAARTAFRDLLEIEAHAWARARGWALYGAVIALGYYRGGRNEALCAQSRQTLACLEVLL